MVTPPRVFVSYSHDSAEHKKWVIDFATTLRNRGIDAVIDQWDLKPGDDLPHFMEKELQNADYVLMICTEKYVEKANSGSGGVGYEKMIMTSSYLQQIGESKVIPIVRQEGTNYRPVFIQSKLYIDFSKDDDVEYSFDELLRTLLNAPLYEKPEIGKNPFKPMEGAAPDRMSDGIKTVMEAMAEASDYTPQNYVSMTEIMQHSSARKIVLERYIGKALEQKLIRVEGYGGIKGRNYAFTDSGLDYLFSKGVVED